MLADPVFVTALLAAEPPHPTPRAHLELLLVVKLWAILVSTSYPHLTHGRVWERLKDIWRWRYWGQIGSCNIVTSVLPEFSIDLLHNLLSTALKKSVIDCPIDERPVEVLILCKEERVEIDRVAREALEQTADLWLAVAFEDLCNYFSLFVGVPCRVAIPGNSFCYADAEEALCNRDASLPGLLPAIPATSSKKRDTLVEVDAEHPVLRSLPFTLLIGEVDLFKVHAALVSPPLANLMSAMLLSFERHTFRCNSLRRSTLAGQPIKPTRMSGSLDWIRPAI